MSRRFHLLIISVFFSLLLFSAVSAQENNAISIERYHMSDLGCEVELSINLDSIVLEAEFGGFDLLIGYNASIIAPLSITSGESLELCQWEYFTYKLEFDSDCVGFNCPTGLIRIIAQSALDLQNPSNLCGLNSSGELAILKFVITYNRDILCQFIPVGFYWKECGNNSFRNLSDNIANISNQVFNVNDQNITSDNTFPSWTGASSECVTSEINRNINFYNGGIDLACYDDVSEPPGDINRNNIPFEIGDYVLFETYFIYGLSVFSINIESQIAQTDVNSDGLSLSVADLTFLKRVIEGDIKPIGNYCNWK